MRSACCRELSQSSRPGTRNTSFMSRVTLISFIGILWVLSGSLCGWGDVFIPEFDGVIYLWLPVETRLARIRERERLRYGADRIASGGDLHTVFEKFLSWAAAYDDASDNLRSRDRELAWLEELSCPVLRIEDALPLSEMVADVIQDWHGVLI